MRKLTLIVLALMLVAMCCACGSSDSDKKADTETTTADATKDTTAATEDTTEVTEDTADVILSGYLFTGNGVQFGVDIPAEDILPKLGEPKDHYTSESCAFGGEDTVYYYDAFEVSTNNELGYDRIYSIYLNSDLVSTEEGICVGSSAEDVKAAYGEPGDKSTDTCLIYEKDGMELSFNLTDGVVSTILYNDI